MRKKLLVSIVLLVIILFGLYFVIPAKIHVSQVQFYPIPSGAVVRSFNNLSKRKVWWPSPVAFNGDTIMYNDLTFTGTSLSSAYIQKLVVYTGSADTVNSYISANQLHHDSSYLYWECTLHCSLSPINRIQQYLRARTIKKSMDAILHAFSAYATTTENIYGISIKRVSITDSMVISEKRDFPVYPGVAQVYDMISSLKQYIGQQDAKETGLPMINITAADNNSFSLMAAIPIDRAIPEQAGKKTKKMLYNGNALMAEVKGGLFSINSGFQKIEDYKADYQLLSPVIPYQSLLTDRTRTTDTAQWVTRLYYPIY